MTSKIANTIKKPFIQICFAFLRLFFGHFLRIILLVRSHLQNLTVYCLCSRCFFGAFLKLWHCNTVGIKFFAQSLDIIKKLD